MRLRGPRLCQIRARCQALPGQQLGIAFPRRHTPQKHVVQRHSNKVRAGGADATELAAGDGKNDSYRQLLHSLDPDTVGRGRVITQTHGRGNELIRQLFCGQALN